MLIKAILDSWYFMKVSNLFMNTFGISLVQIEKISEGKISESINGFRATSLTHQEAAVLTLAGLFTASLDRNLDDISPDFWKLARQGMIIDGWAAEGKIRPDIHALYVDSVESALAPRSR